MKQVLWISRHEMTAEQRVDLERALESPVALLPWRDTVTDVRELLPALRDADAVAAVLPLELLGALLRLAGEKPVLLSQSARIPTGRTRASPEGREEPEFAFVHTGWRRLVRLEIETMPL